MAFLYVDLMYCIFNLINTSFVNDRADSHQQRRSFLQEYADPKDFLDQYLKVAVFEESQLLQQRITSSKALKKIEGPSDIETITPVAFIVPLILSNLIFLHVL